jgi:hypothetical protein
MLELSDTVAAAVVAGPGGGGNTVGVVVVGASVVILDVVGINVELVVRTLGVVEVG